MDINTIRNVADADHIIQTITKQLLIAVNNLSEVASRDPAGFYEVIGKDAEKRAEQHRELILLLTLLDPSMSARIRWPKNEVIYLADGSAYPTAIKFDKSRPTLIADDIASAKALEAEILAE